VLDVVRELLVDAGRVLVAHRTAERTVERKSSHWNLVSDADRAAEECLIERLARLAPDDAVLSEESGFHPGRSERTWVLDPLDGTTNFVAGLDDFGVIIGVTERGRPVGGGMYLPVHDLLYLAEAGGGVTRNGSPVHASATDRLEDTFLDHSLAYLPSIVEAQRRTLDLLLPAVRAIRCNHSLRYIANVVDGTYDAFVYHSLSLWDILGPAVLLAEAGATVSGLDGRPLDLAPTAGSTSRVQAAVAANPTLHAQLTRLFAPT
jgi:myo-inositol-1(or 4)-monophosphatase